MRIEQSIRKIGGYAKKVEASTNSSLKRNTRKIAELNIQQMEKGEKPDGSQIWPEGYSEATEAMNQFRRTKVTAGEPIILKDTGAFYTGMYRGVKATEKNTVEIKSADSKSDELETMYQPFGLSENNLEIIAEKIYQDLYKDLKAYFK